MKRVLLLIGIGVAVLLVAGVTGLSLMTGGLSGAYGMVRYALPHMKRGTLRVGDDAPDATLLALDGTTRFHLRERTGPRPLVVVFGSYT